ncbi:MAG: hypothetical protein HYU54_07180 [Actinobacteria bacterium]|nr:hypothetical protein [Actinomycetota bacterium]
MIVCPQCRQINAEEAEFCSRCGRSLEPGPTFMGPARRTESQLSVEIKTPQPPSRWRPVILLAAALGIVVGFAAWKLLEPDPCRGRDFTSERFGYCLTVPEGWTDGTAQVGNTPLDQFSVPTEPTTVLVEAVDLPAETDLAQFGEFVRQKDGEAGLTPGPVRAVTLDGMDAARGRGGEGRGRMADHAERLRRGFPRSRPVLPADARFLALRLIVRDASAGTMGRPCE